MIVEAIDHFDEVPLHFPSVLRGISFCFCELYTKYNVILVDWVIVISLSVDCSLEDVSL